MVKEATAEDKRTKVSDILVDKIYWLGSCHLT
jgi:hypothetical protein